MTIQLSVRVFEESQLRSFVLSLLLGFVVFPTHRPILNMTVTVKKNVSMVKYKIPWDFMPIDDTKNPTSQIVDLKICKNGSEHKKTLYFRCL